MTKFYAKFNKFDEDQRIVEGYASTEALDSQGEKVTRSAIVNALADYMKYGNIREMHQPSAVGKTIFAEMDEKGLKISVKVVDDIAWKKVKEEVYNGFSIGGTATVKIDNVIEEMVLSEISLVDRPANPEALITLYKADNLPTKGNEKMKINKSTAGAALQQIAQYNLKKSCGMLNVADLASILNNLSWIVCDAEWEKQYENDGSGVPAQLRGGYKLLSEALAAMVVEETSEEIATQETLAAQDTTQAVTDVVAAEKMAKAEDAEEEEETAKSEDELDTTKSEDEQDTEKSEEGEEVKEEAATAEEDAVAAAGEVAADAEDAPKENKFNLSDEQIGALEATYKMMEEFGFLELMGKKKAADAPAAGSDEEAADAELAAKAEEEAAVAAAAEEEGDDTTKSDDEGAETPEADEEVDGADEGEEEEEDAEEEEGKDKKEEGAEKMAKAFGALKTANADAKILKAAGLSNVQEAVNTIKKLNNDLAAIKKAVSELPKVTKGALMVVGRDGLVEEVSAQTLIEKGEKPLDVLTKLLGGEIPSGINNKFDF